MQRTASLPIFIEGHSSRRRGSGTLQEQIYRSVRQSIREGLAGADRRLPSTRTLAKRLGVSRTTALLALEQLRAEGYVVARRGSGTFIAPRLPERLPPQVVPSGSAVARPPFSRRGLLLSQLSAPDRRRSDVAPCAFRLGTPALDLFPQRIWAQITRECLRVRKPALLDYSKLAGLRSLREAIAEQMQSRGTRCDADQVQVVTGAQRGLDLIARMLLDPGDHAWMEDPGYTGARGAMLAASATVVPVPVDADGMVIGGNQSRHDVRLAYVTPSCQFPLGVALSLARRHSLLAWARKSQAWIVEDDYDCDLRHEQRPLPCLHALDPDGRVIYVGTFSKTLFPALRLGFLIVPRDLQAGFVTARLASEMHPPVLEQRVLEAFIARGHYERHLRRMQAVYSERLDALTRAIERSGAPLRLRPVQAGIHAVVDLESVDAECVHHAALARGIETMPLSAYYIGEGPRPNALLLGFGAVPPAALRAGVSRLARVIETLMREG
ncbi:MAG TPA: PLP-dependent aminotransferase family protein [Steroidobacteraceae bacterium]|nr:PLP-dependent aminotransferase family protein [Steroidobacteraceae bacterium]